MAEDERQEALVGALRDEAPGIRSYELLPAGTHGLLPFTAGAHIDVELPGVPVRQYSLCNPPTETHRYRIAVKREPAGRGGSIALFDTVKSGDRLIIGKPQNHFPVIPGARRHVLVAGGIGITPLLAMAYHLHGQEREFTLHYCTRSAEMTAFRDELLHSAFRDRIAFHHDDGDPARGIEFRAVAQPFATDTHLYCCGPRGLMSALRDATPNWPGGTVHFEDFAPVMPASSDRPFKIKIASTGTVLDVPADKTILMVLREHGYSPPSSCQSGTCGTCITGLVEGRVDHRDFVLDPSERASFLMVCISRAETEGGVLVLDL